MKYLESTIIDSFEEYEIKFKALGDKKRLELLHLLCQHGKVCVCDLCDMLQMPQSKLSYHLRILLDAQLINKETKGTWSYYEINKEEISGLLSEKLCCIFRPEDCC